MTPAQCKEARRLLGWTQRQLSEAAGSLYTVIGRRFERVGVVSKAKSGQDSRAAIRAALKAAGIEFIERTDGGPGVRLRKAEP